MLDATFIAPAARHLAEARQIRRDLPKLKAQVARYHHISPMDRQREVDRMKARFFRHIAWARHYTEKGRHYTRGDGFLRFAAYLEPDQPGIAAMLRDHARRCFEQSDRVPLPDL